jgi:hypothetical protein
VSARTFAVALRSGVIKGASEKGSAILLKALYCSPDTKQGHTETRAPNAADSTLRPHWLL